MYSSCFRHRIAAVSSAPQCFGILQKSQLKNQYECKRFLRSGAVAGRKKLRPAPVKGNETNTDKTEDDDYTRTYLIPGKATVEGTEQFILNSEIQLYHKFNVSKLFINPVIHGPPRLSPIKYRKPINRKNADKQLLTAVCRNCSNMIYVYNHYSNTHVAGYWSTSILPQIMLNPTINTKPNNEKNTEKNTDKSINEKPNPYYRPRESIVTVAGLGLVSGFDETFRRLNQALETTGLQYIDFAVIEVRSNYYYFILHLIFLFDMTLFFRYCEMFFYTFVLLCQCFFTLFCYEFSVRSILQLKCTYQEMCS